MHQVIYGTRYYERCLTFGVRGAVGHVMSDSLLQPFSLMTTPPSIGRHQQNQMVEIGELEANLGVQHANE